MFWIALVVYTSLSDVFSPINRLWIGTKDPEVTPCRTGYGAVLVRILNGHSPPSHYPTIDAAKGLRSRIDRSSIYTLAKQALQHLPAYEFVQAREVATIGFSIGCVPALQLARSKPDAARVMVLF